MYNNVRKLKINFLFCFYRKKKKKNNELQNISIDPKFLTVYLIMRPDFNPVPDG